jgi:hypothetical protein
MADTAEKGLPVLPPAPDDARSGRVLAPGRPAGRAEPPPRRSDAADGAERPITAADGVDGALRSEPDPHTGQDLAGDPDEDPDEDLDDDTDAAADRRLALAARTAGERIRLVPSGYALALSMILVALFGLVSWSVFGTVPSSVHLTGVLVHGDGPSPVPAPAAGTVVSVAVRPGQKVRRGEKVAVVQTASGRHSPVTATAEGTVLGVVSAPGTAVAPGTPVVSVDLSDGGLTGWLFVRADRGYPAAAGSSVTARLSSGDSVVTMDGTVRGIGSYPMTGSEISRMLGGLPARLAVSGDGPYRLVTVSMRALGVTGSAHLALSGQEASEVPALIPLVADVRTGSVRPIDALVGGH